jgi:hypothetical protein
MIMAFWPLWVRHSVIMVDATLDRIDAERIS